MAKNYVPMKKLFTTLGFYVKMYVVKIGIYQNP